MKIGGKKLEGVSTRRIIIPRQDEDIVIIAKGITSYAEFNKICPPPDPVMKIYPDGRKELDSENPDYRKALTKWSERKGQWMILESLSATPDLEWEKVKIDDPETWGSYHQELVDAGFVEYEIARIVDGVMTANGINQEMIMEAEKRFLAGQGRAQ
jgi:hypothetical protein